MASGPLADMLGYRSFFLCVMVASMASVIAAYVAPFPNPPDDGDPVERDDERGCAEREQLQPAA